MTSLLDSSWLMMALNLCILQCNHRHASVGLPTLVFAAQDDFLPNLVYVLTELPIYENKVATSGSCW